MLSAQALVSALPQAMPHALQLAGKPQCANDDGSFCQTVWNWTGHNPSLGWLASSSEWLLVKPFRIILILVVALLVRWVLHRMIRRFTRVKDNGSTPAILRPLKERVDAQLRENGVLSERRRQRSATIGSLLRNVSSILVFSIAVMMILSELGMDLGPLLASAGIAGVALGFGAQSLVKDVISGMFMLLEDQYGVGDLINVGDITGTVEAVGLRITTVRDGAGVLWYIRNGEVVQIGNYSQSWAMVIVDVPVGFGAPVGEATDALQRAADSLGDDEDWVADFIAKPEVLGVQQLTPEGALLRVTAKTTSESQWKVGRELRRRIVLEMEQAGVSLGLDPRRFLAQEDGQQ